MLEWTKPHSSTAQQQLSPLLRSAELQAAFLGSKYVGKDQEVLLKLLLSCKGLHAEVARHCAGELTAVLHPQELQHAAFAKWLQRHTGLLQGIELTLCSSDGLCLPEVARTLAGALSKQQQHLQGLQRFTLNSTFRAVGGSEILLQLPASLKMLDLSGHYADRDRNLQALARLQQLTELHLGSVQPCQL
jgi:hypothetical protein